MAVYSNGIATKKLLVAVTYQQLLQKDASKIRVRDIAEMSGCSPATIYRHFETLEYLIVVSSMRILDAYTVEYGELIDRALDPASTYREGWGLFDRHAFNRPDIYLRLFWGPYNDSFESAAQEYYELFPYSGSTRNTAYFFIMFFNGSMQERDYMALRNIANVGLITTGDARYLSQVNPIIAKGMIEDSVGLDASARARMRDNCDALIYQGLERAIEQHTDGDGPMAQALDEQITEKDNSRKQN